MRVFLEAPTEEEGVRRQPWTVSERDPGARYYNFRERPELIREVLEDFKPWEHYEGVRRFYELLEWLNGEESKLETSDCRFTGPIRNTQRDQFPWELACGGRLIFFFRQLTRNLSDDVSGWMVGKRGGMSPPLYEPNKYVRWLAESSHQMLSSVDGDFWWPVVQIHYFPSFFADAPGEESQKFGYQVVYEFHTWADTEEDIFHDFNSLINIFRGCLTAISSEVPD
jgi:hypothetical protein